MHLTRVPGCCLSVGAFDSRESTSAAQEREYLALLGMAMETYAQFLLDQRRGREAVQQQLGAVGVAKKMGPGHEEQVCVACLHGPWAGVGPLLGSHSGWQGLLGERGG